ncbi:MAG: hypothetical protein IPK82_23500 [Polyangiaceae bacterium]|nr:hypothetical protein [Polyangiaceae bacterium]
MDVDHPLALVALAAGFGVGGDFVDTGKAAFVIRDCFCKLAAGSMLNKAPVVLAMGLYLFLCGAAGRFGALLYPRYSFV